MTHSTLNRRHFLFSSAALLTFAASGGVSLAASWVNYKDGYVKKALSQGKTLFVDYAADWCGTCKRQERVIKELRAENPDFNKMVFVRVDWDDFRTAPIATEYKIPRRSTLLVLKGSQELGRIVAGTSKSDIEALMKKGLAALG